MNHKQEIDKRKCKVCGKWIGWRSANAMYCKHCYRKHNIYTNNGNNHDEKKEETVLVIY